MLGVESNLVAITDVPAHLPAKHGRRIHISAIYRWMQKGVRGVKLAYITIGGTRYTSLEALQHFAEEVTRARETNPILLRGHSAIREKQIAVAQHQVDLMLKSKRH